MAIPSRPAIDLNAASWGHFQPRWSHSLPGTPRGVALAREKGWVLAWDDKDFLSLFSPIGTLQARWKAPCALTTASCADDGSAYVAASARGDLWWLAPDLGLRWQHSFGVKMLAAHLEPLGGYVATSDAQGMLRVLDREGTARFGVVCPRPLHHIQLLAEIPFLIGSGDFGLVACYDFAGQQRWRDGLVAHVGAIAASGDGEEVLLACFSEGLLRYSAKGGNRGRLPLSEPCRLVAASYDCRRAVAVGLSERILVVDPQQGVQGEHGLTVPVVGLALGALGDVIALALADGRVQCLDLIPR